MRISIPGLGVLRLDHEANVAIPQQLQRDAAQRTAPTPNPPLQFPVAAPLTVTP